MHALSLTGSETRSLLHMQIHIVLYDTRWQASNNSPHTKTDKIQIPSRWPGYPWSVVSYILGDPSIIHHPPAIAIKSPWYLDLISSQNIKSKSSGFSNPIQLNCVMFFGEIVVMFL